MDKNLIYNEDCLEGLKRVPDGSVDCILTDPPYLYLKRQKLERPFDEDKLFSEFDRIVKPTGFVVLFGRGESFYRWNTKLIGLGFKFKEEVIWDKGANTSPLNQLMRYHETVSILSKKGTLNVTYVPYVEQRSTDFNRAIQDINKIASVLGNTERIETLKEFIESGKNNCVGERSHGFNVAEKGLQKQMDRDCITLRSIQHGMREGSIIRLKRDKRNDVIHPTQKPVRLMERLLALTTKQGDLVVDPFCGSCPVGIACVNMDRDFIGWEIDEEYYNGGLGRYEAAKRDKEVANG